jgi:1,4-alpha-glucan branching enzyme
MRYEESHFINTSAPVWNYSLFSDEVIALFQQGLLRNAYEYFGSKKLEVHKTDGFYFSVWAPHAKKVFVAGDFNAWNQHSHLLYPRLDKSGIWEGFIPKVSHGEHYKYVIETASGENLLKSDPYAFYSEFRPSTASRAWQLHYQWNDKKWMRFRKKYNSLQAPWNVYELHLGSWMKPNKHDENSFNSYRQTADLLIPYLLKTGFTHVELMPVMEYPYDKSWGYQCTGYFAATSRYGAPEDLMYLIDQLHQNNIGVILDWVPSHFPSDAHGLFRFDGAHTYEYADMRKGYHPDWNSYIFNYGRGEVRSFLISSAHFWLHYYHADGIRVDAVNSIIRLDFSRKPGDWEPNIYGGNENIEAIEFLKQMNLILYEDFPDIQTIAEEASDWPGITLPVHLGGFGFGMKWMMGWMHDTFKYFKTHHHQRHQLQDVFSFSMMYFYNENFMLPLSHDEVVHGKSPMIYKMPGLEHEKFATLRVLYGYMYTHPGAKLLFMGNEFAQTTEWQEQTELNWELLQFVSHNKMLDYVAALSHLYKSEPALYQMQFEPDGFEWVELDRRTDGVMAFKRKGKRKKDDLLVVLNVSGNHYHQWSMKISGKKTWKEILNTNDIAFWGTGQLLNPELICSSTNKKTMTCEIIFDIPALSMQIFK